MAKIKIKESVLRSMIAEAAKKVIKEGNYDDNRSYGDNDNENFEDFQNPNENNVDDNVEYSVNDLQPIDINKAKSVFDNGYIVYIQDSKGRPSSTVNLFGLRKDAWDASMNIYKGQGTPEEYGFENIINWIKERNNGEEIKFYTLYKKIPYLIESKKIKTSVKQLTEAIKKAIKEEKLRLVIKNAISESKDDNWIAGATKNKGGLHKKLGIPEGDKIPQSLINSKIKEIKGKYKDGEKMSAADEKFLKELDLAKTLKKVNEDIDVKTTDFDQDVIDSVDYILTMFDQNPYKAFNYVYKNHDKLDFSDGMMQYLRKYIDVNISDLPLQRSEPDDEYDDNMRHINSRNNSNLGESKKPQIKEGVAQNNPKIEKYVNQINALIAQAVDSDGDKIGVIEPNSTWEEPYTYDPIIYQNGALKIVSYSPHSNQGKANVDIIRSRDMELDGIPTLQLLSRMFKKAVKNKDKY